MARKDKPEAEVVETEAPEREGWVRVVVSSIDAGTEAHAFVASARLDANGKPSKTGTMKEVARVDRVVTALMPTTEEALQEALSGAKTSFDLPDGKKLVIEGPVGPAARVYLSNKVEPVRGEMRKAGLAGKEWSADKLQSEMDAYEPYSGRTGGFKKTKVERDTLREIMAIEDPIEREAALAGYLEEQGAEVN